MIQKKAQAAMEFLMTYGWAILVVLAAIGALAYFGVLNPEKQLPEKCYMPPGISCVGFSYIDGNIEIAIINNQIYTMLNTSVSAEGCPINSEVVPQIKNNEDYKFLIPCDLSGQERIDKKIFFQYINKESELKHTKEGQLQMRIVQTGEIIKQIPEPEEEPEQPPTPPQEQTYTFQATINARDTHALQQNATTQTKILDGIDVTISKTNSLLHIEFEDELQNNNIINLYVTPCAQKGIIQVREEGKTKVVGTGNCIANYQGWIDITIRNATERSRKWDINSLDATIDYDYIGNS